MELAKRLRNITKEDAVASYNELKEIACKKVKPFARAGIKALDYFVLGLRLKAKTKHGFSFADAMRDSSRVSYLNDKVRQIRPNPDKIFSDPDELLRHQYAVFQLYYGSINQFRPTEALRVYCTLAPQHGILDFSAGRRDHQRYSCFGLGGHWPLGRQTRHGGQSGALQKILRH